MQNPIGQLSAEEGKNLKTHLFNLLKNSEIFIMDSLLQVIKDSLLQPTPKTLYEDRASTVLQMNDVRVVCQSNQFETTLKLLSNFFPNIAKKTLADEFKDWLIDLAKAAFSDNILKSDFEKIPDAKRLDLKKASNNFLDELIETFQGKTLRRLMRENARK